VIDAYVRTNRGFPARGPLWTSLSVAKASVVKSVLRQVLRANGPAISSKPRHV